MELIDKRIDSWFEQKFGGNLDVNGTVETVWDGGGAYSWQAAAESLEIVAENAADQNIVVDVTGLDANYDMQTVSVTTDGADGTTPVAISGTFIRVWRAKVTSGTTTGYLRVRVPGPGATRAEIADGNYQTLMAIFTVPAGFTCHFQSYFYTVTATKDVEVSIFARPFGEVFQLKHRSNTVGGNRQHVFDPPLQFSEKTDFDLRCLSSIGAGAEVFGGFALTFRETAAGPKNN